MANEENMTNHNGKSATNGNGSSNGKRNGIPYTEEDLKALEDEKYKFHVDVLGTDEKVARRISANSIKPLRKEMAALAAKK